MDIRMIERKSIKVNIRGEEFEIYSLSIRDIEYLKKCINLLFTGFIKQASVILNLDVALQGIFKKDLPPATKAFIQGFLDTMTTDILKLLASASGLPERFFLPKLKRRWQDRLRNRFWAWGMRNPDCLTIAEMIALGEIILEVNNLDFFGKALRNWLAEKNPIYTGPSARSSNVIQDIPLS